MITNGVRIELAGNEHSQTFLADDIGNWPLGQHIHKLKVKAANYCEKKSIIMICIQLIRGRDHWTIIIDAFVLVFRFLKLFN